MDQSQVSTKYHEDNETANLTQSQWVQHPDPRFWRQSKIMVFGVIISFSFCSKIDINILPQVENTLFCVDLEPLTAHSNPLNQIFNIPTSTESSEGTEANPIIIEGIYADEFSQFVLWVYHV